MIFQFYDKLKAQPDLHDVMKHLDEPIKKLKELENRFTRLSMDDKNNLLLTEIERKIDKLKNKYFPNLIEVYCNLTIDYRNTVIIKELVINNKITPCTSKDIFLKNLSKLIEEINITEEEFYTHYPKSVKNHDIVEKSKVEVKNITNNVEIENELSNKITFKEDIKCSKIFETVESKPYKWTLLGEINSIFNGVIGQVFLVVGFIICAGIGVHTIYSQAQEAHKIIETAKMINEFHLNINKILEILPNKDYKQVNNEYLYSKGLGAAHYQEGQTKNLFNEYKSGKYLNAFGGKIVFKPATLVKPNDSVAIITDNISSHQCNKLAKYIQRNHPKIMKINDKILIEDGFIDERSIINSCSLENNTFTVIN